MGVTTMQILDNFLAKLKQRKVRELSEQKLDALIKAYLGADPRTFRKYKQLMQEFGMIQRTKDGKIKINYAYNII